MLSSLPIKERNHQLGINMVDLMMWLVIAALLLAAAIQGIGYYQKAANLQVLKSDLTGASQNVMAAASLNKGVIDMDVLNEALLDTKSSAQVNLSAEESTNGGLPILRAIHPVINDLDVIYLFEACAPYTIGVNVVPKNGSSFTESCGIGNSPSSGSGGGSATPTPPDVDKDGIPDATDPDIDNDGIPNAEDRDANGDGVRDDYVPGGAITEPDGEPYAYAGNFKNSLVGNGGTTVYAYVHSNGTPQAQRLAAHFIATCVRPDGSEYGVNGLNGFNSTTTAQPNAVIQFTNCAPNRVYSYVIKPVTKEAMASGKISNPDFFGGYTFSGGYRWSEPDGYIYSGDLVSSMVTMGGQTVQSTYNYDSAPEARRLASHYELTCVRTDKTTYKKSVLNGANSVANSAGSFTVTTSCATGELISNYKIAPVTKLGAVSNPDFFGGYTLRGERSWSELVDGYPVTGAYVSSYSSGPSVYATYKPESHPQIRRLAVQYEVTCVRPDKSSYQKNGLNGTNSTANSSSNVGFTLVTCNTGDLVSSYKVYPVRTLGTASNPDFFGGYTMSGGTEWVESVNGHQTGGTINSATMNTAKTSLSVSMTVDAGHGIKRFAIQYKLTCLNSTGGEYKVNNISIFNSRNPSEGFYSATLSCGGNRIISSEVSPVNDLRSASDPSGFGGWTLTGTHNWAG